MKLEEITIENFGSIKNRAVIDLRKLKNDLFMLSGGTGAGKSTILDAISFGLYGRCSGAKRGKLRTVELLSTYAISYDPKDNSEKRAPIYVEVKFENNGKHYAVQRSVSWGSKGTNKTPTYDNVLYADGVELERYANDPKNSGVKGSSRENPLNDAVEELIGLDVDQFNQIVILPQGEFGNFMEAKASDKEQILSRLVKSENYKDLQLRLKAGAKYANDAKEALEKDINTQLELLKNCDCVAETDRINYRMTNVKLLEELQALVNGVEGEQAREEKEKADLNKQRDALLGQRSAGETVNEDIKELQDKLSKTKTDLDNLKKGAAQIAQRRHDVTALENLIKVVPDYKAMHTAEADVTNNATKISKLEDVIATLKKKLPALETAREGASAHEPEAEAHKAEITRLEGVLAVYDQLQGAMTNCSDKEKALKAANNKASQAKSHYDEKVEEKSKLEQEIAGYGTLSQAEIELEKNTLQTITDRGVALDNLQKQVNTLKREEVKVLQDKRQVKTLKDEMTKLQREWIDLGQRFYQGQAASLAAEMRKQLEEKDEAGNYLHPTVACPVCGVVHTLKEMEQCKPEGEVIEKAELDTAESKFNKANEAYLDEDRKLAEAESKLQKGKEHLVEIATPLLGVATFAELTAEANPIKVSLEECREAYKQVKAKVEALEKKLREKDAKVTALTEVSNALPGLESTWREADKLAVDANNAVVEANAAKDSLVQQLQGYPATKKAATDKVAALKKANEAIVEAIDKAKNALEECHKKISSQEAVLETLRQHQDELVAKLAAAKAELDKVLAAKGFADAQAFVAGVTQNGLAVKEAKLADKLELLKEAHEKAIKVYEDKEAELLLLKKNYEDALAGKTLVDLEPLNTAIAELDGKIGAVETSLKGLGADLKTIAGVSAEVKKLMKKRAHVLKVCEVITAPAAIANGTITFNRFVLGRMFERILEQANKRIAKISGGEFEFKMVEELHEGGKSQQGLDFDVYNVITGHRHKASDLSGGEQFEVSMSLALGLSDVIQSISKKGVALETFFMDEGFGTLGETNLQKCLELLLEIAGTNRQVGIISHSPVLEDAIDKKILVTRNLDNEGTKITTNF